MIILHSIFLQEAISIEVFRTPIKIRKGKHDIANVYRNMVVSQLVVPIAIKAIFASATSHQL